MLEVFTNESSPAVTGLLGCIYRDDCTAFLIDSMTVIDFIEGSRPDFPIPRIEAMVVLREDTSMLQLNVDEMPDRVADEDDDIVNLQGSVSRKLESSDSLDNMLHVRRGLRELASL